MARTEILTPDHLYTLSQWAEVLSTTVPALVLAHAEDVAREEAEEAAREAAWAEEMEHGGW